MAKHFGMEFYLGELDHLVSRTVGIGLIVVKDTDTIPPDALVEFSNHHQIYMHPDSLQLLEPMEGDLVEVHDLDKDSGISIKEVTVQYTGNTAWDLGYLNIQELLRGVLGEFEVVKRSGKHFFWPEREP